MVLLPLVSTAFFFLFSVIFPRIIIRVGLVTSSGFLFCHWFHGTVSSVAPTLSAYFPCSIGFAPANPERIDIAQKGGLLCAEGEAFGALRRRAAAREELFILNEEGFQFRGRCVHEKGVAQLYKCARKGLFPWAKFGENRRDFQKAYDHVTVLKSYIDSFYAFFALYLSLDFLHLGFQTAANLTSLYPLSVSPHVFLDQVLPVRIDKRVSAQKYKLVQLSISQLIAQLVSESER
mmetsp:Transcript_18592/g.25883  ORF Transcript_18592/g.25883 Transcript_18592/m.25883 type:complete len:234 (+) Transcript_18592:1611-2312(+)